MHCSSLASFLILLMTPGLLALNINRNEEALRSVKLASEAVTSDSPMAEGGAIFPTHTKKSAHLFDLVSRAGESCGSDDDCGGFEFCTDEGVCAAFEDEGWGDDDGEGGDGDSEGNSSCDPSDDNCVCDQGGCQEVDFFSCDPSDDNCVCDQGGCQVIDPDDE